MNTPLLCAFALLTATITGFGAEPIRIWPGTVPGEKAALPPEVNVTGPHDRRPAGRAVVRISNVSDPTITVFSPAPERNTGAAVVVCPGGAYVRLAIDLEGTEVCDWLNSIGVTGILLKYRVPRREGLPQWLPPVQDAQRAFGIVRSRAKEWGIDPNRIGIIGFSAGAHVAGVLSSHAVGRLYAAVDVADRVSCRPDFVLVIYPGYFTGEDHGVSREVAIAPDQKSPTFIVQTEDDPVHVENALWYFEALKRANVPAEMHLYPTGGHGYGLRRTADSVSTWPDRAADWLRAGGWLTRQP